MAGEIVKTRGLVLAVRPWSRTSHVVTWLTPDRGAVATLVKGAVRPKSAFLGQYDLFYTCELLYYARARGELHAIRETVPVALRENLRADWRAVSLAAYACDLARDLAPPGAESAAWFAALETFLDALAADGPAAAPDPAARALARLVSLEMSLLALAGLAPDFAGIDPAAPWSPFAVDRGRCGAGARTVRLSPRTVRALERPDAPARTREELEDAARFLGVFLAFHLERAPDIRRALVNLLLTPSA